MYENHNIVLSFQVGVPIEGRKVNKQGQWLQKLKSRSISMGSSLRLIFHRAIMYTEHSAVFNKRHGCKPHAPSWFQCAQRVVGCLHTWESISYDANMWKHSDRMITVYLSFNWCFHVLSHDDHESLLNNL